MKLQQRVRAAVAPGARSVMGKLGLHSEPDFLIIGTQKGGTTSLYEYLIQHPRVCAARRKEIHYFDRFEGLGWNWYRSQFPLAAARPGVVTGEATPYYLFHPDIPRRVAAALPEVKLISVLRNPADRAYSHYQHSLRHDVGLTSFADALAMERQLLAEHGGEEGFYDRDDWHRHSYATRGYYAEQLERWFHEFPRDRHLVLTSEDLKTDPAMQIARVVTFLGLPEWKPAAFPSHHRGGYSVEPGDRAALAELRTHYGPPNLRLGKLLGQDFSGWDDATIDPGADSGADSGA